MVASSITAYFGQSLLAAITAGAIAGFLVWNFYPAKVFMGDTGALFLGGNYHRFRFWYQPAVCTGFCGNNIYSRNLVGSAAGALYFKATGGRQLFKMSPLHHHFEMSGWKETKVVAVFSFVTLLGLRTGGCVFIVLTFSGLAAAATKRKTRAVRFFKYD